MGKIKKIWIFILSILLGLSSTNAVTLWTLRWPIGWDVSEQTTTIQGQRSIFNMISLVNNYLWFAIGFVCFVFMVRNGYQLIIARGDEKQMKSATNSLIWCAVWLTVCILAHIVVNIAVKLFAD
jgi:hypothetical protein